jgi:hypothetical protein
VTRSPVMGFSQTSPIRIGVRSGGACGSGCDMRTTLPRWDQSGSMKAILQPLGRWPSPPSSVVGRSRRSSVRRPPRQADDFRARPDFAVGPEAVSLELSKSFPVYDRKPTCDPPRSHRGDCYPLIQAAESGVAGSAGLPISRHENVSHKERRRYAQSRWRTRAPLRRVRVEA